MLTGNGIFQIVLYLSILILCIQPLGWYMARVYQGKPCGLNQIFSPFEKWIYKCCGIQKIGMDWKQYLSAMLIFNLLCILLVYSMQRLQFFFPLNPQNFPAVPADLAFNTAISFVSNTDWQAYSGETTMSYFTQMLSLTVQNFASAATGMSLMVALIRGLVQNEENNLGNFWIDTIRGTLYILLPLAIIFSILLGSQGVIQNFLPNQKINLVQSLSYQTPTETKVITNQTIPMGPVASQVAIKQLGSNGGGFFNTNSAHPFENPTPLSNFLEVLAILLIPASLCYTFSVMVNDQRQGVALLIAMFILFIPFVFMNYAAEQVGNPALTKMGVDPHPSLMYAGGNMEGKETRFGISNSALWLTSSTATSNGSVNAMADSFTPLGGLITLWMMHLGEVVFGGVGTGLYGMLMLVILTVFIAGLMVGRTPEYLGKKIEPYEMKMAVIAVLLMPTIVLIFTGLAAVLPAGVSAIGNPGAHGFSEILYAFTSPANNNGSAFAGLNANTPFYNLVIGLVMLVGRYWVAIPVLAIAGSLARKKIVPITSGTLITHTPLFIILLVSVTIVVGALSFLPALALGPIVEQLLLWGQYGH